MVLRVTGVCTTPASVPVGTAAMRDTAQRMNWHMLRPEARGIPGTGTNGKGQYIYWTI